MSAHLRDVEHPYYCNEGNYYASESVGCRYESWADFMAEFGGSDMDMNLVFRWDWQGANPDDGLDEDQLLVFFMGQRKGKYFYAVISPILPEDEPSVRAWLQPRLDHLLSLWAPLAPALPACAQEVEAP